MTAPAAATSAITVIAAVVLIAMSAPPAAAQGLPAASPAPAAAPAAAQGATTAPGDAATAAAQGAPTGGPAAPTPLTARVAVEQFAIEGEDASPALALQLEDGFVLGFAHAGIALLDSAAVSRKLEATPELKKCEISLCLKRLGDALDVAYLMRVKVAVAGNGYKATARLFRTTDSSTAVLPIKTQSSACDICTVAEARDMMIRLADAIKQPIEEAARQAPPPAPPPADPLRALAPSLIVAAGVAAAIIGGAIVFGSPDPTNGESALGGFLMGTGLSTAAVGLYILVSPDGDRILGRASLAYVTRW